MYVKKEKGNLHTCEVYGVFPQGCKEDNNTNNVASGAETTLKDTKGNET